ncbi:MAG TPA: hypothetical protein VGG34_00445 [Opitutaceae bacterium]|jgi:hypothetical protein
MSGLPERKVTVEQLLRLKRAERPSPEFWAQFEAQMRAKQLSAIVERRPWWAGLSRFAAFGRMQVSLGAAAALALSFAGYRLVEGQLAPGPASEVAALPVRSPAAAGRSAAVPAARSVREVVATVAGRTPSAPRPLVAADAPHIVPAPAAAALAAETTRSPFADGIAVTLADYREPVSAPRPDVFGSDRDFEAETLTARAQVADPLARMDTEAERRARILSPALPLARAYAADWMRQRTSTDDRIYESMDRAMSDDHQLGGIRF